MKNRKEEILSVALQLFARDGYEAVSVRRKRNFQDNYSKY